MAIRSRRTRQVPKGRPAFGEPPFSWEQSALDALTMPPHSLHRVSAWTIERIAYELEKYNGFGYRRFHPGVKSPYLWSYSNHYTAGKYVADGQWSSAAESTQCGAMVLIRRLAALDASVAKLVGGATPVGQDKTPPPPDIPSPEPTPAPQGRRVGGLFLSWLFAQLKGRDMLAIITALLPLITKVFDKAIADPNERAKAQEKSPRLLENQAAIFEGMKAVMVADAQSESPLTRNARPIVVYWSLSVISLIVVAAAFGFAGPILDALKAVPDKLWDLMTYGIGAYVLGRSAEKAVTNWRGK